MNLYTAKYSDGVGAATGYAGFRNRRRLQVLTKLIPVSEKDTVLEIGPNKGLLLDALKEKVKAIVGIDINEEAVSSAGHPDVICMDAAAMTFEDAVFDTVIGIEVFEHIPALQKVFSEVARVLVPEGNCYMTVPFELFRGQQALGDAWHTYRNLSMARQLHVHKLNPQKIKKLVRGTGLQVVASGLVWIPGPSYFIVLQKRS